MLSRLPYESLTCHRSQVDASFAHVLVVDETQEFFWKGKATLFV